jgi:hypothetical protein
MPDGVGTARAEGRSALPVKEPIKVCLLGATGAGKTCFLAGLAVLSEPDRASIITVLHDNKGTADYLDSLQDTLRNGQWPPPNNATFILDMTVLVDGRAIDLRVVDYPGEDFTGALRTLDTHEIEDLYRFSQQAHIYLLLFSPHRDLSVGDANASTKALLDRQRAHLQAITQVWKEREVGTQSEQARSHPMELGLVITQCDRVPGLTSPQSAKGFFTSRAPNLVSKLTDLADSADFFGISILGKPAQGDGTRVTIENAPPPSQLDPFGYEPLFRWIRDYQKRHRTRRLRPWLWGGLLSSTAVLAICFAVWKSHVDHVRAVLASDRPAIERIEDTSGWMLDTATNQQRLELIRDTLQQITGDIERAETLDEFDRLDKEVAKLAKADTDTFRVQASTLQQNLTARTRSVLFAALRDDFQSSPRPADFQSRASAFIDRYQSGEEVDAVRRMQREIGNEQLAANRARLRGMPTRDSLDIAAKARQIIEFVNKNESNLAPEEARRMRRAADLARSFSERKNWKVTIKKSGGLTDEYAHLVLLGNKKLGSQELHVFDGAATGSTKDKVWAIDPAVFSWQAGEPITVTLQARGTIFGGWVAYQADDSSLAIGSLVGRRNLLPRAGYEAYVRDPYVVFEVENLSSSDWESVKAYISPGSDW